MIILFNFADFVNKKNTVKNFDEGYSIPNYESNNTTKMQNIYKSNDRSYEKF